MASDQSRLKIHIDGDNSGFRQSLRDSENQVRKTMQGTVFGQFAGALGMMGAGFAAGRQRHSAAMQAHRMNMLRGGGMRGIGAYLGSGQTGLMGTLRTAGFGMRHHLRQFIAGSSTEEARFQDPPLAQRVGANRAERNRNRMRALRNMGGFANMAGGGIMGAARVGIGGAVAGIGGAMQGLSAFLGPTIASLLTAGPVVAAIGVLTTKFIGNTLRLQDNAKQYSAPVLMQQAMTDLLEVKRGLSLARNPEYQQQMIRQIQSTDRWNNAGIGSSGTSLWREMTMGATDAGSWILNFIQGIREFGMGGVGGGMSAAFNYANQMGASKDAQYAISSGGIK